MKAVRRTPGGGQGHRHTPPGQHEHEYEPQHGLPEALPEGEHLLWQGAPDWKTLAVRRFHVRKLVLYFAVLLALRLASLMSDDLGLGAALWGTLPMLALSAIAVGLVTLIAWFTASTTVYTVTDKRVAMRIGIVLTITLNLPYRRIEAADLRLHTGDIGDISLRLMRPDHFAYLHLWPHARPWRLMRTEPTMLCISDAKAVALRLTQAWKVVTGDANGATERSTASHAAVGADRAPRWATH